MTGGGSLEAERIAALETDIKYLVRAVDNLTNNLANNYATKSEVSLVREEVKAIKEDKKHTHAMVIAYISAFVAVSGVIVAIWAVLHK